MSLKRRAFAIWRIYMTSFFCKMCLHKLRFNMNFPCQDYKNGGCIMIHIDSYIKSLKLTWLRRLLRSECSWTKLFCDISNCSLSKLQSCGDYYSNVCACNTANPFWKETLHILQDFHYKLLLEETDICKMPVWYNSFIKSIINHILMRAYSKKVSI